MNQEKKIKAVVFDLYGTLICSPDSIRPYHNFFRKLGLTTEDLSVARRIVMTECLETFEAAAQRLKPGVAIDFTECYQELARKLEATHPYPETKAVLTELKRRGLKIGLISNLSWHFKQPFLDLGLADYFDQLVYSFAVGWVKPEPQIYQLMIDLLGLKPEQILMTGDQFAKDVEAPRAAGLQAVHLDRAGNHKTPGSIATLDGIFQYL